MKSTPTPHTHTGKTTEEITTTVGPSKFPVTVPAGVRVIKLEGGRPTWVVDDISFIDKSNYILHSDSDTYGIRIPEDKITDIKEKPKAGSSFSM